MSSKETRTVTSRMKKKNSSRQLSLPIEKRRSAPAPEAPEDDSAAALPDDPAHCLFVITRDVSRDLSASHLLRVATWDRRRGAEVVVFLIDKAVGTDGPGASGARLEALATAGVPLFASPPVLTHLGDDAARLGIVAARDDDLAPLMREPGVRAIWC